MKNYICYFSLKFVVFFTITFWKYQLDSILYQKCYLSQNYHPTLFIQKTVYRKNENHCKTKRIFTPLRIQNVLFLI